MAIKDRNLADGTKLVLRYKGATHNATVVKENDQLHVRLGKKVFSSLSAAATSISRHAENGWSRWTVVGAKAPAMSGQPRPKTKSKAKKASRAKRDATHPKVQPKRGELLAEVVVTEAEEPACALPFPANEQEPEVVQGDLEHPEAGADRDEPRL